MSEPDKGAGNAWDQELENGQSGDLGRETVSLEEELGTEEMKLVENIRVSPLPSDSPDLKHRIVYVTAQAIHNVISNCAYSNPVIFWWHEATNDKRC
jgi:hypothetical protein